MHKDDTNLLKTKFEDATNLVNKLKSLLNIIPDPIFMKDENLHWIYANDSILDLYKIDKDNYIGKSDAQLLPQESIDYCAQSDKDTLNAHKPLHIEEVLVDKHNLTHYYDVVKVPFFSQENKFQGLIGIGRDITQQKKAQQELAKSMLTDNLTSLYNRAKLSKDLANMRTPSIAIFDIDDFSDINDFYGHEVGDFILKELAKNIRKLDNSQSLIYRYNSDQFALIIDNTNKEKFLSIIQFTLKQLNTMIYKYNDISISLHLSVAISFEAKKDILQTADIILGELKKKRVNFLIYSKDLGIENRIKDNIEWTKKINDALQENRIVSYYQPILNNHTGKIEKYESLVRMIDPDGSVISPIHFLDIAKKSKQYIAITKKVIENTFEMFKEVDLEFSINLTLEDILSSEIKTLLESKIKDKYYDSRVVYEIVESEGIEDIEDVYEFINKVHECACQIAIDDFGTGYSNFEYLIKLNPDYIKIDGSMIKDITIDTDKEEVVKTIIDFAKKRNLKTIAEYVYSKEIFDKVVALGIDYSQGYYIGKPEKDLVV